MGSNEGYDQSCGTRRFVGRYKDTFYADLATQRIEHLRKETVAAVPAAPLPHKTLPPADQSATPDPRDLGVILRKTLGVTSAKELNGATLCVVVGANGESQAKAYFKSNHMEYKQVAFPTRNEAIQAYVQGRCDAYVSDRNAFNEVRAQLPRSAEHVVLPENIAASPK